MRPIETTLRPRDQEQNIILPGAAFARAEWAANRRRQAELCVGGRTI